MLSDDDHDVRSVSIVANSVTAAVHLNYDYMYVYSAIQLKTIMVLIGKSLYLFSQ